MSCLLAPSGDLSNDLFDQFLFTDVPTRPRQRNRPKVAAVLFESPLAPIRRHVGEISVRPEEDNERWDGLS